jgi:hypothetical protein
MNTLSTNDAANLLTTLSGFTANLVSDPNVCDERTFVAGDKKVTVELQRHRALVSVNGVGLGTVPANDDTFQGYVDLVRQSQDVSDLLTSVVETDPGPVRYKSMPPARFKLALGQTTRLAIRQAVAYEGSDAGELTKKAILGDWWDILNDPTLTAVSVEDPDTVAALEYLVSLGFLTEAEKDTILLGVSV